MTLQGNSLFILGHQFLVEDMCFVLSNFSPIVCVVVVVCVCVCMCVCVCVCVCVCMGWWWAPSLPVILIKREGGGIWFHSRAPDSSLWVVEQCDWAHLVLIDTTGILYKLESEAEAHEGS